LGGRRKFQGARQKKGKIGMGGAERGVQTIRPWVNAPSAKKRGEFGLFQGRIIHGKNRKERRGVKVQRKTSCSPRLWGMAKGGSKLRNEQKKKKRQGTMGGGARRKSGEREKGSKKGPGIISVCIPEL